MKKIFEFILFAAPIVLTASCSKSQFVEFRGTRIRVNVLGVTGERETKGEKTVYDGFFRLPEENGQPEIFVHRYVTSDFGAIVESGPATKGTIKTTADFNDGTVKNFRFQGFFTETPSDETVAAEYPDGWYICDRVDYDEDEGWSFNDGEYYWQGVPMRFWAVYPNMVGNPEAGYATYNDCIGASSPNVTLEDYWATDCDTDILMAFATASSGKVPVTFRHAMAAVNFIDATGESGMTLTGVAIRGVHKGGTCVFDGADFSWTDLMDGTTYEKTVSDGRTIADGDMVFFITPQVLGNGASVVLTFQDGDGATHERVVYVGEDGAEWKAGYKYTYKVSLTSVDYRYVVIPHGADFETGEIGPDCLSGYTYDWTTALTKASISAAMVVESYKISSTGEKTVLPILAEYSLDGGVTWATQRDRSFHELEFSEPMYPIEDNCWVYIMVEQMFRSKSSVGDDIIAAHSSALRANSVVSSENAPYDLSMHDIYGNVRKSGMPVTANCYVVNAPGYYMLPLVYGNAIDYSMSATGDNPSSYIGVDAEFRNGYSGPFPNYKDEGITSPFIETDLGCSYTDLNACVVWQEVATGQEIIRDASVGVIAAPSSAPLTCGYLKFKVDSADIKQGNVVLAVRNSSNEIVWSWNIWVTDDDLMTRKIEKPDGVHMMLRPLGATDAPSNVECETSTYLLKFTQYEPESPVINSCKVKGDGPEYEWDPETARRTKADVIIPMTRVADEIVFTEKAQTALLFQGGRKDPILPLVGGYNPANKAWTSSTGYTPGNPDGVSLNYIIGNSTIGASIQHPDIVYFDEDEFFFINDYWSNLWDNDGCKTIYDPCPPGFRIFGDGDFRSFAIDGKRPDETNSPFVVDYASDPDSFKGVEPLNACGWRLYLKPMPGKGIWDASAGSVYMPFVMRRTSEPMVFESEISRYSGWEFYYPYSANEFENGERAFRAFKLYLTSVSPTGHGSNDICPVWPVQYSPLYQTIMSENGFTVRDTDDDYSGRIVL